MKVGIIGAGRMGCALARGLKEKGMNISGVYSRSGESAELLNSLLGTSLPNDVHEAVGTSELIFISVSDGAVEQTAKEVAALVRREAVEGKVFLHCSGALTSECLSPIKHKGGHTGSLHPIQTFADREEGWRGLFNIYFGFEGCQAARGMAEAVAKALEGRLLDIKSEDKALYHAAACVVSNYTVTLSYMAQNMLCAAGISPEDAQAAFLPLLEKTVGNISGLGSSRALTGPVSRGDSGTVQGHVDVIEKKLPEIVSIYKALGRETLKIALGRNSMDDEKAEALKRILER